MSRFPAPWKKTLASIDRAILNRLLRPMTANAISAKSAKLAMQTGKMHPLFFGSEQKHVLLTNHRVEGELYQGKRKLLLDCRKSL